MITERVYCMKIKKGMLKAAAAVLCIVLLISSACISVLAAENTPLGSIVWLPLSVTSENIETDPDYLTYKSFLEENSGVVSAVYDGITSFSSSIDISEYDVSRGDASTLIQLMYHSFPELFYVSRYSYSYEDDKLYTIYPKYIDGNIEEMKQEFFASAEHYLSLVDDSMDDFTKAVILHDALVLDSRYTQDDAVFFGNNYTYMVEGWGTCQYYSECYAYLLAQCGIESEIINSTAMGHEWLKVKLDGSYYNIDLTWDDPIPDKVGKVKHTFFLYSDAAFQTADTDIQRGRHYNYQSINNADSAFYDRFDNLHHFNTKLCYVDGNFYAITPDGRLVRYNHSDDSITVLDTLDFNWKAGENFAWRGNYSSLVDYDKKLYYNSPDAVYQYDPATRKTKLFAEGNGTEPLYGLRIIDNQLWGVYASDPTVGYVEPVYLKDIPKPVYTVTVDSGIINGTVAADKQTAVEGEVVTLTVSPGEGFEAVSVTANQMQVIPRNGVYSFRMPAENVVVSAVFENGHHTLLGDVDGDGKVTIVDATYIQRYLVDFKMDSFNEAAADVDGDGVVTIVDATLIQRYLVEIPVNFPINQYIK